MLCYFFLGGVWNYANWRFTMYYIKQSNNCNFRDMEVAEDRGGGDLSNYICSTDKDKLLNLVQELKRAIDYFWDSKDRKPFEKDKKYWWVTVDEKNHLKTIHCKCDIIADKNGSPDKNYFESSDDAYLLLELICSKIAIMLI